jgi:hypothetical protein
MVRIHSPFCAFKKADAYSASAADATVTAMMELREWIEPLMEEGASLLPM